MQQRWRASILHPASTGSPACANNIPTRLSDVRIVTDAGENNPAFREVGRFGQPFDSGGKQRVRWGSRRLAHVPVSVEDLAK